jgi:GNAT superfamily N-acetyltransferase
MLRPYTKPTRKYQFTKPPIHKTHPRKDTMLEISTDNNRLQTATIFSMLENSYWANKRPRATILKSLQHSLNFGAYQDGQMIGFARVVTDYAVFAYLCDVVVLEAFQKQGVGKKLMQAVLEHPDLQGLRRFLLATRDAHGLYAQFGFEPLSNPERWMHKFNHDV